MYTYIATSCEQRHGTKNSKKHLIYDSSLNARILAGYRQLLSMKILSQYFVLFVTCTRVYIQQIFYFLNAPVAIISYNTCTCSNKSLTNCMQVLTQIHLLNFRFFFVDPHKLTKVSMHYNKLKVFTLPIFV